MKMIRYALCMTVTIVIEASVGILLSRAQGLPDLIPQRPPLSGVVEFDPSKIIPPDQPAAEPDAAAPLVGSNIRVNQDTGTRPQNETTIAINPLNALNLAAGANDYATANNDSGCGFYSSSDGGATWVGGTPMRGGTGFDAAGDPAVAFDLNGNVYYSCLSFNRTTRANEIRVFKSTDGGRSYPTSALVASGASSTDFHDKEYIATDTTASLYKNSIYVTWTHFRTADSPIRFSKSTNGGTSFSSSIIISDTQNNQFSQPAVGPDGQIYVTWRDYNINRILLDKSTDGGTTWNALGGDKQVVSITPKDSINQMNRANTNPSLAVDSVSIEYRGFIYVVWHDGRNGDADVLFVRSIDGGASWSAPVRVNDDAIGNGRDQFFPWISVGPDGEINVMWYDRRLDAGNKFFHVFFARSVDGGVTFSANTQVTTVASDPCVSFGCPAGFIGDYNGMASSLNKAHPFWMDTRNGNQDVFTAAINTVGGLLFDDQFNRTTGLGAAWKIYGGGSSSWATDGAYAVSKGTVNWAGVSGTWTATDYVVESVLVVPTNAGYNGIIARGNATDLTQSGYSAQISEPSNEVRLYRREPAGWVLLKAVPASGGINPNTRYKLKLRVAESTPVYLEVYFQDILAPVISYSDSSANRILSGIPGMVNYTTNVKYDYFTVTEP